MFFADFEPNKLDGVRRRELRGRLACGRLLGRHGAQDVRAQTHFQSFTKEGQQCHEATILSTNFGTLETVCVHFRRLQHCDLVARHSSQPEPDPMVHAWCPSILEETRIVIHLFRTPTIEVLQTRPAQCHIKSRRRQRVEDDSEVRFFESFELGYDEC